MNTPRSRPGSGSRTANRTSIVNGSPWSSDDEATSAESSTAAERRTSGRSGEAANVASASDAIASCGSWAGTG
jgi:hypothetical protein